MNSEDLHIVPLAHARYRVLAGPNGERVYTITMIAPNGDAATFGTDERGIEMHRKSIESMQLAGLEDD